MLECNSYKCIDRHVENEMKISGNQLVETNDGNGQNSDLNSTLCPLSFESYSKMGYGKWQCENQKQSNHVSSDYNGNFNDVTSVPKEHIYKSPRLQSIPYEDVEKQKERQERLLNRQKKRRHKSELLQTIKSKYSDRPEEEDYDGGTIQERQRNMVSKLSEVEAEQLRFEEERMFRMTMSRKNKKMRKKVIRERKTNLSSITNIGNITESFDSEFGSSLMKK